MLDGGATLDQVAARLEARARGADEERRSAAWLEDWCAFEHRGRAPTVRDEELPGANLEPLE